MPWSLPRRTARVIAFVPKRWRMSSSTPSTGPRSVERQGELDDAVVGEVRDREAEQRDPLAADPLERRLEEAAGDGEDRRRVIGGLIDRVRPGDPLEALEPQAQHDGSPDAAGVAEPARHAVDDADEHGIERLERARHPPEGALRSDRPAAPACLHAAGVAVVGEGVDVVAAARSEDRDERRLRHRRDVADRVHAAGVELGRGLGADAPDPLDRQRVQERELAIGRHHEQPVRLRHRTGDLGEELRAGDPDADRQVDAFPHLLAQPDRDLRPACRRSAAGRRRRGTPRRPRSPRRTAWCR